MQTAELDNSLRESEAGRALSESAARELTDNGFVVIPGFVADDRLSRLSTAYDRVIGSAVQSGSSGECAISDSNIRVSNLLNRDPEFDRLFFSPLILEACSIVIGEEFKLSGVRARTVRPGAAKQKLHVDVNRGEDGWPLLGTIVMVDAFREDNGATRFLPGSQKWTTQPDDSDVAASRDMEVAACGAAGSLIIFNGSTWHDFGANTTAQPRRSIQASYIPRDVRSACDWRTELSLEALNRLTPHARSVLAM